MTFATWLKQLPWVAIRKTRPIRKSGPSRSRFTPQVEQLETRLTPAGPFVVTNTDDPTAWMSDSGSLRYEIYQAHLAGGTQTITFNLTKATGTTITINDNNGPLEYLDSNTLNGVNAGTGGSIFIHGGASHGNFLINSSSPTIENLTIEDGNALGSTAGGISFGGGTLTLTSDTFVGNQSPGQLGGAIEIGSGTVDITSCAFGNSSGGGNSAKSGGAIYLASGTLKISSSTFTGNTATKSGGAIYVNNGTVTLSADTFTSNSATSSSGGVIYAKAGTFTDTGSMYTSNSAGRDGAAIFGGNATITLTGDSFSTNTTPKLGGAIYMDQGKLTLTGGTLSGNSATNGGGAIYNDAATATVTNATLKNNSGASGGAIYLRKSTASLILSGDTLSGNTATTGKGGGIYMLSGSVTTTADTFSGNASKTNEGGTICLSAGNLTSTEDGFSGNTSSGPGGGIYLNNGTVTLTSDTLSTNQASIGGAIYIFLNTATLTADDCTFTGNFITSNQGGAIYNSNGNLTFASDTFTKNKAKTGGGIFGHTDGNIKVFDTILDGNTGGDVYNVVGTAPNLGIFTSSGGNLYGSTTGVTWKTTSTVGALYPDVHDAAGNPMLGSLAPNGGYTETMAPLSGSPALGAGNPFTSLTTDQRGFTRVVNNKIDIGAYENQSQLFTLTPPSSNTVGATSWNLGSFSDVLPATPWSVAVSWGDGTTTSFSTSSQGSLGTQTHYYASATSYTITVSITDNDGNFSTMSFGVTGGPLVVNTLNDLSHAVGYPTPTSPLDSKGNISLRSALEYVNYYNLPATIDFSSTLSGTINLKSTLGDLQITDTSNLTIDGTGASITVSGASFTSASRGGVFSINQSTNPSPSTVVTINDLGIIDGTSLNEGGGIYSHDCKLTLTNDTIEFNTAMQDSGGGVYSDHGTLTLRNDTIAYNVLTENTSDGGGVCSNSQGSLTVTNSSILHNTASGSGGGIAVKPVGNVTLTDDTIADNSAAAFGGGVFLAITGTGNNGTITNVTITGNSAASGGGIYEVNEPLALNNSTLTGNKATNTGGGIYIDSGSSSTVKPFDSILDSNSKTSGSTFVAFSDVYAANGATLTSNSGNLYGVASGPGSITWKPNPIDIQDNKDNPGLGSLQNNGGTTQTMAVLPGSLAYQNRPTQRHRRRRSAAHRPARFVADCEQPN